MASIDLGKYNSKTLEDFTNQYFDAAGTAINSDRLKTDQHGTIQVESFKADYVHPLGKSVKLNRV